MIQPARLRRILGLALPIIGGMVSQNILNLVDTAMVGFLGTAALAAVGIGGFTVFMSMALVLGVSTGVQATAARRKGEGKVAVIAESLNAGLLLVLLVAPLLSVGLLWVMPYVFPLLTQDPEVVELGLAYVSIRLMAIVFIGINFAFRGYWNAVDMSRLYMMTLVIMHACNIAISYVLIFGKLGFPALGVEGAAIGTAVSTAIGAAMYFVLGLKHARANGFLTRWPGAAVVRRLAQVSFPAGLQQLFFSAGLLAMFVIIGRIGTVEMAAASVLINVMLVAILPGMGFGLASATLVGQALGKGDVHDARAWGWDVTKVSIVVLSLLGAPMALAPELILSLFIHDPLTLEAARLPMQLTGIIMPIEAIVMALMNSLLGCGDTRRVMVVAVVAQWVLFLPGAVLVGPVLGFGLLGIWILQGISRLLQAGAFWSFWVGDRWARIDV